MARYLDRRAAIEEDRSMRLVTTMGILAALIAGCGSSSDNKSTTTQAASTSATTAATTPTETAPASTTAATETTTTAETAAASPDSTTRPDKDGDGTPDIQTFRGKPGDSFTLVGQPGYKKASKEAVKVTVLGVTGAFTGFNLGAGRKLIGIKVRFVGAGTKLYDDPQPNGQLTVTGGETGKQTSLITGSGKNPCDNPSLKLRKGKSVSSCLAFEIPKNAKPQVFEYGASSGYGDTGIWKFK
jgi:hypothetical protein